MRRANVDAKAARRALFVVAIVALGACASRYERGGQCWTEPDKGGVPMQCPPPGVWWAQPDAGAIEADDENDYEPDAGDNDSGGF